MRISHLFLLWLCLLALACGDDSPGNAADAGVDAAPPQCLVGDRDPSPAEFCPGTADLAAHVDPFIGTDGEGNVIPGALVPHGMVRLSPDTNSRRSSVYAYHYLNTLIEGFTHLHLQGHGGDSNGYNNILLIPTTGALEVDIEDYASAFSHLSEQASPGYYAVTLDDYGVRAELTATAHAGFHRYTFPESAESRVLFDLGPSLGESIGGAIEVVDEDTIEGYGVYTVHLQVAPIFGSDGTATNTVYFAAELSKPMSSFGTFKRAAGRITATDGLGAESGPKVGAYANFATTADEVVEVRVGISMVSVEQARRNLEEEIGAQSFDEVHEAARAAWNCRLNRLSVETASDDDKKLFYTAFYHSLFQPADYTEAGGVFQSAAGGDVEIYACDERRYYSDDWCLWDTYRSSRPLATLVEPEIVDDTVASYLHVFAQGGWLPKCSWSAAGYPRVMIGNHTVAVIADAITKGFDDFDLDLMWQALSKTASQVELNPLTEDFCGVGSIGTVPEYIEQGYVSHECDSRQSVSMTLEFAYNDWTIAQTARALGKPADVIGSFTARGQNYRNHWDSTEGFMRGKVLDGSWVEPFDPATSPGYTEANSWIYTFFVPHDVPGLIELMGGNSALVAKLDAFFDGGYFDPRNEPSFHTPFLYNYAGEPAKTQERVRQTVRSSFDTSPAGLPGQDDSGAMSAWLLFSSMGIYPIAPGEPRYDIASPIFDRVVFKLDPAFYSGGEFVLETVGGSDANIYVQSATLNGDPIDRTYITHDEIVAGGVLRLVMGDAPSTWGAGQ